MLYLPRYKQISLNLTLNIDLIADMQTMNQAIFRALCDALIATRSYLDAKLLVNADKSLIVILLNFELRRIQYLKRFKDYDKFFQF